jgi:P27 family predicted phage terminase small subunit
MRGIDLAAFELLASALATHRQAAEIVERDGYTVSVRGGGSKPHPAVRIMETALTQATRLMSDLGLTPRGRSTIPDPSDAPLRFHHIINYN